MDLSTFEFIDELVITTPNNRCRPAVSTLGSTGNTESRINITSINGNTREEKESVMNTFFSDFATSNTYLFTKENLIEYLNEIKFEYENQYIQDYNGVSLEYWQERFNEVNNFEDDDLTFNINSHLVDSKKRCFIGSDDDIFYFKGAILIPNLSCIRIKKYRDMNDDTFTYLFSIEIDPNASRRVNQIKALIKENSEEYNEEYNDVDFRIDFEIQDLTFEDKKRIEKQINKALKSGKHIILTGPPGTGKSKLAKKICEQYNVKYRMTTAISDWSTYETIGGYKMNRDSELYFDAGIFLSCFKDNVNGVKNEWLIIDEMNRADIDKAFGVFFSALAGDDVNLSFKDKNNNNIEIVNENNISDITTVQSHQYVIPNDWRLIGTINTLDKASLYEMSYAFMRRFAFIPISIPKNIDETLVLDYMNIWSISDINIGSNTLSYGLSEIWKLINNYRAIGPAILKDIGKYVEEIDDWTSAIILYVLPQFEGMDETDVKNFISDLTGLSVDGIKNGEDKLIEFIEDFFGISL